MLLVAVRGFAVEELGEQRRHGSGQARPSPRSPRLRGLAGGRPARKPARISIDAELPIGRCPINAAISNGCEKTAEKSATDDGRVRDPSDEHAGGGAPGPESREEWGAGAVPLRKGMWMTERMRSRARRGERRQRRGSTVRARPQPVQVATSTWCSCCGSRSQRESRCEEAELPRVEGRA